MMLTLTSVAQQRCRVAKLSCYGLLSRLRFSPSHLSGQHAWVVLPRLLRLTDMHGLRLSVQRVEFALMQASCAELGSQRSAWLARDYP